MKKVLKILNQKKNNLKIIIPDNSNDDLEPSKSGSKLSQNTPSNSPLICIDKIKNKNEEKKNICLNKDDANINENKELFKVIPHFLNDNKASSESLKEENFLKRLIVPNKDNERKIKDPLTCDSYKRFVNYKFNFNFETKEKGMIIPKEKIKEEKRPKKISIAFRIGNKNLDYNKNRILNINKHNYSNNKIYSRKDSQNDKVNHSPLNSSLKSLKYKK